MQMGRYTLSFILDVLANFLNNACFKFLKQQFMNPHAGMFLTARLEIMPILLRSYLYLYSYNFAKAHSL